MYEEWLSARAPGFGQLGKEEKEEFAGFLYLWALFEGRLLGESGSPGRICDFAAKCREGDLALSVSMRAALDYWRHRYFPDGNPNFHFESLLFRRNDRRQIVEAVMTGELHDPASVVAAILLIIYRLRNNLFHGNKWDYGLADQHGNFSHANRVLMEILGRYGNL